MVVQRKKASDYKNHKVSWPKGGISLLSKRGAISATISGYLIVIGLIIFIGHWLDVFNMVMPGTLFDQWGFGLLEIGMFLIFLGVFVYVVLRSIAKAPLLQKNHPYLEESKHHDY